METCETQHISHEIFKGNREESFRKQNTASSVKNSAGFHTWNSSHELSIVTIQSCHSRNFQETESLFSGYDEKIDVNLLKWMAYVITALFFTGMALFFLLKLKKSSPHFRAGWPFLLCLLVYLGFLKMELFSETAEFPLWVLPGTWSDLEGWGTLWKNMGLQFEIIFRFRDCPVLINYYQNLTGCFSFLALCLLALFLLRQNPDFR